MLNNKTRVENFANHGIDLAHKNQELSRYLDSISHNLREKTQLVEYVERYPNGTFVEIGTGGDPLKELLSALPTNLNPTIIACDINPDVLESLIARNPELREFMCESENGPKLETRVVNAVSMPFQDESISGLNLSAVFHEIYSYSGGNEAIIKSFEESYRVLEKEGILLYRDPEHIDNPEDIVNMDLKTRDAKLLTNLFLAKFLDHQFTRLKDSNGRSIKPNAYSQDIIKFRYYPKNSSECTELSFPEYLKIPSKDIDFSRSVSLTAPRGLCREIERHFITFLYDCNPLVFAKLTKSDDTGSHKISFLTDKIAKTFSTFVNRSNIEMVDNRITDAGKNKIEEEIYFKTKYMEFGVPVVFGNPAKKQKFLEFLSERGFNPNSYVYPAVYSNAVYVDCKILSLFYQELNSSIFDLTNRPFHKDFEDTSKWVQREGEEHYFYKTTDDILTEMLSLSLDKSQNDLGESDPYVLCPLSNETNFFVLRDGYTTLLNDSIEVTRIKDGGKELLKDGKRIIHFQKMPLSRAKLIIAKIIESEPTKYQKLTDLLKNLN